MTIVKLQKKFDIEVCLKAEKFIQNFETSYEELKQIFDLKDKIGFIVLKKMVDFYSNWVSYQFCEEIESKEDCDDELENYEFQIMLDHFSLSLITDRTLLFPEFEVRYESNTYLCEMARKQVWEHNTHCEVFFLNTYKEIIKGIDIIAGGQECEPTLVLYATRWIFKMIKIIDTYRKNFRYCARCEFDSGKKCEFWGRVMSNILGYTSRRYENGLRIFKDLKSLGNEITRYFKRLLIHCKILDGVSKLTSKRKEVAIEKSLTNNRCKNRGGDCC
ncbi:MAG: hypothetical protein GF329_18025 [Candidatus Lokiarchaeota archaeon]|nr:hypothetical protein [Candidatus Lokiarchaeota archaeon]